MQSESLAYFANSSATVLLYRSLIATEIVVALRFCWGSLKVTTSHSEVKRNSGGPSATDAG